MDYLINTAFICINKTDDEFNPSLILLGTLITVYLTIGAFLNSKIR